MKPKNKKQLNEILQTYNGQKLSVTFVVDHPDKSWLTNNMSLIQVRMCGILTTKYVEDHEMYFIQHESEDSSICFKPENVKSIAPTKKVIETDIQGVLELEL